MVSFEWDPEKHFNLPYFNGIHFFDLTMSLEERIETSHFNCKSMKESNPLQCMERFQMEKLNCSFPWHNQSSIGLKPCMSTEDVANLGKLVFKLRQVESIERQELSNMDCWVPKCNRTSWKRGIMTHQESNVTRLKIYVYSSSGVSIISFNEKSKTRAVQ